MYRHLLGVIVTTKISGVRGSYKCSALVTNHLAESSKLTPMEKLGGRPIDLQEESHVFGAQCYNYAIPENARTDKIDKTTALAMWVGLDAEVSGGHRVIPIRWNSVKQRWDFSKPVTARTIVVHDEIKPLTTD